MLKLRVLLAAPGAVVRNDAFSEKIDMPRAIASAIKVSIQPAFYAATVKGAANIGVPASWKMVHISFGIVAYVFGGM